MYANHAPKGERVGINAECRWIKKKRIKRKKTTLWSSSVCTLHERDVRNVSFRFVDIITISLSYAPQCLPRSTLSLQRTVKYVLDGGGVKKKILRLSKPRAVIINIIIISVDYCLSWINTEIPMFYTAKIVSGLY